MVLDFDLDQHVGPEGPGGRKGSADTACVPDMILLDQYRVVQPNAVILSATAGHRVLLRKP